MCRDPAIYLSKSTTLVNCKCIELLLHNHTNVKLDGRPIHQLSPDLTPLPHVGPVPPHRRPTFPPIPREYKRKSTDYPPVYSTPQLGALPIDTKSQRHGPFFDRTRGGFLMDPSATALLRTLVSAAPEATVF